MSSMEINPSVHALSGVNGNGEVKAPSEKSKVASWLLRRGLCQACKFLHNYELFEISLTYIVTVW